MSRLGQIDRVKHVLDRQTLITVINALVFSKLFYCSNVWANTTGKNINKLQSVQNFACRIVSGARKYDHVTPLLKELIKLKFLFTTAQLRHSVLNDCVKFNIFGSVHAMKTEIPPFDSEIKDSTNSSL
jgi:uncharacterized membrane protein YjjP (DUF1212 family)